MTADIVQFREDPQELAYVRSRGHAPNEFAREAFRRYVRRLRAEETVRRLVDIKADIPDIAAILREDRASH